ncbi:MAG: protease complex subunit PrcB family protein [Eubacterium sp.]
MNKIICTIIYFYKEYIMVLFMCKKILLILLVTVIIAAAFASGGCTMENLSDKKLKDLEFTVLADENVPKELLEAIEQKKSEVFNMTFSDKESTYIVVGYGSQPTGGYTIVVDELYETKNSICLKTTFNGPPKTEQVSNLESCPYMVIKIEYNEKPVVYE